MPPSILIYIFSSFCTPYLMVVHNNMDNFFFFYTRNYLKFLEIKQTKNKMYYFLLNLYLYIYIYIIDTTKVCI